MSEPIIYERADPTVEGGATLIPAADQARDPAKRYRAIADAADGTPRLVVLDAAETAARLAEEAAADAAAPAAAARARLAATDAALARGVEDLIAALAGKGLLDPQADLPRALTDLIAERAAARVTLAR